MAALCASHGIKRKRKEKLILKESHDYPHDPDHHRYLHRPLSFLSLRELIQLILYLQVSLSFIEEAASLQLCVKKPFQSLDPPPPESYSIREFVVPGPRKRIFLT